MSINYSLFAFPKGSSSKRRKDISITNRDKVKQIFHYQCALCGKKGTQIHHIVYKSEDRSKIDDIDNLILLCTECHQRVHSNKDYWQEKLKGLRKEFK